MEVKIQKLHLIPHEQQDDVMHIIKEREQYYQKLFSHHRHAPQITLTYEGRNPLSVRIVFAPHGGRRVLISVAGYDHPSSVTKYAFKKLRRVAKNYFVKNKHRHRG